MRVGSASKVKLVATMLTAVLFASVVSGQLHQRHGEHGEHGESHDSHDTHAAIVADRLQLTESQQKQLNPLIEQAHRAMMKFHQLHEEISAHLSTAQRQELGGLMHEAMGQLVGAYAPSEIHHKSGSGMHQAGKDGGHDHGVHDGHGNQGNDRDVVPN